MDFGIFLDFVLRPGGTPPEAVHCSLKLLTEEVMPAFKQRRKRRMQTLEPILAQHPFFQNLDPAYRRLIVGCAGNVRFRAGEFLFHEGGAADRFYLIRHGRVALQVFIPGRGETAIDTIEAGDVLGWSWLFPPYRWHFDAQATELVRAVGFDGECLRSKCEADHDLGYALMQRFARIIVQRLQATRLQIFNLYGTQTAGGHPL